MGNPKGFMNHTRKEFQKENPKTRIGHWNEFVRYFEDKDIREQGSRCMDCGVPFCMSGCPIGNIIPDWNDLVYNGDWEKAIIRLHQTNNFPEFTGRVCPAPCENSCVLGINQPAVTIKNIEVSIIERAYENGWVKPNPPAKRTGKTVAVVGSGPAGLACADQLNRAGHKVTVYEKNEVIGGLLTLGIPEFKLEKKIVKRRVDLMEKEGVEFKTGMHVGVNVSAAELQSEYDAVVLCGGAEQPRDLPIPGNDLNGVVQAMKFLPQQNRECLGIAVDEKERILAKGKRVVVLGGGDTGSDCVGTSNRQGAVWIKQFELMPEPPADRTENNPWPQWAFIKRTSTSHEEGVERDYCIMTKRFSGENGQLKKLHAVRLEFGPKDPKTGRPEMKEVAGSEFELDVDLVILAMGFLGPVKSGMLEQFGVKLTERGNVQTDVNKMTNIDGVFAAGDMARGQSLVVWAIQEGRAAARGVDLYLMKQSSLLAV